MGHFAGDRAVRGQQLRRSNTRQESGILRYSVISEWQKRDRRRIKSSEMLSFKIFFTSVNCVNIEIYLHTH